MAIEDDDAHRNFVGFNRFLGRLDPGARELDDVEQGVRAVAGTADWPSSRVALRSGPGLEGAAWVERADGFLRAHGSAACVFARVDADADLVEPLLAAGYQEWSTTPEMICRAALPAVESVDGVTVRLASTAEDVAAYAHVAGQAFADMGIPAEETRAVLDHPQAILVPEVCVALGEVEGEVVAGAMALLVGDRPDAYVAWVATLGAARGKGLGDLVTRTVTNEAFRRGAGFASLEASPFGENIYRRMGYEERYRYRVLLRFEA